MSTPVLKAAYSAPNHESFVTSQELSTAPVTATTTTDKTAYLAALRTAVTAIQENVNKELTARMVIDAQAATDQAAADVAAEAEEQNYGEEVMEED
ncbi:hypothetical protein Sste5346_001968 [Sporothrix stenoceras]|uniref:EKC/KEOPS complex subunit GON7 n=1 Tax=Sporothrix stenoceras TaxID=5173 RepID=A0ABR3ZL02_9PEZI